MARVRGADVWATIVALLVVALIVIAQLLRPSARDALLFMALGVLIAVGRRQGQRFSVRRPSRRLPAWMGVLVEVAVIGLLLGLGLVLVFAPRFGAADLVVVALLGMVAIALAWGQRDDLDRAIHDIRSAGAHERRALRRAAWGWSALAVSLGAWELAAFVLGGTGMANPPPAVSDLIDPLADVWPSRAVIVAVWLTGGVWLTHAARRAGRRGWRPSADPGAGNRPDSPGSPGRSTH